MAGSRTGRWDKGWKGDQATVGKGSTSTWFSLRTGDVVACLVAAEKETEQRKAADVGQSGHHGGKEVEGHAGASEKPGGAHVGSVGPVLVPAAHHSVSSSRWQICKDHRNPWICCRRRPRALHLPPALPDWQAQLRHFQRRWENLSLGRSLDVR